MSNSWAVWNIIKHRLAGTGDGKDLLGHLIRGSANSELAPRVMCWPLRGKKAAKSFGFACYTCSRKEKLKTPHLMNRLQVIEDWQCQENLIASPSPHQVPARSKGVASHPGVEHFQTEWPNTMLFRTKNHRGRLCPWALYGNSDFSGSYVENIYQNSSYWSMPGEGGFLLNWCLQLTLIQPRHSLYYPLLYHLARVGTKSPACSVRTPATNHHQAPHK